jgi:hypothetical protein
MKKWLWMRFLALSISIITFGLLSGCGGGGSSGSSNSTVSNVVPVANAGVDQNVKTGALVTLDGSKCSDTNSDELIYSWAMISKPEGSQAQLTNPSLINPMFTPDKDGSYVISLFVNDGKASSPAVTITINATTLNVAPVANAGTAQTVSPNSLVTLNGNASSDANGDTLSYTWSFITTPSGSTASLSNTKIVNPTFTADVLGEYWIELEVSDGKLTSTSSVTVTATAGMQVGSVSLTDGINQIQVSWPALPTGSVQGYNVYSKYYLRSSMHADVDQYNPNSYVPVYTPWQKLNTSPLVSNSFIATTEEYNAGYGFYVLPVSISGAESSYIDKTTKVSYLHFPQNANIICSFKLTDKIGPFSIPNGSNDISLRVYFFGEFGSDDVGSVLVSADGISWSNIGSLYPADDFCHPGGDSQYVKDPCGWIYHISLNSYKGGKVYFKTAGGSSAISFNVVEWVKDYNTGTISVSW